jgi:glycosyltransferase involved in cell wall biosynthesis
MAEAVAVNHSSMRLLIVADAYPPQRMSGAVQMRDLVQGFAAAGHQPTILVPSPALPRPQVTEVHRGITTVRVRTAPTKDVDYVRRTINELRLPGRLLAGLRRAGFSPSGWDGVIWYSPSIFLSPVARIAKHASECHAYLILRDIFPEWAVDVGLMKRGAAYRFFKWIERRQYAIADTIGVQCAANVPYVRSQSQPQVRVEVLENWLSPALVQRCSLDISRSRLVGRRIVVYTGNMGVAQGMDVFLDLARDMAHRRDLGFLFVGRGSEARRLQATAEQTGLENVLFHDEIDTAEIPGLLKQADVAIVALDPRHTSHNIPGKFLTYMQAGLPVLARINPGNDLETLIQEHDVGRACVGGDASVLGKHLEQMLSDPEFLGRAAGNARSLWQSRFATDTAVRQVIASLTQRRDVL